MNIVTEMGTSSIGDVQCRHGKRCGDFRTGTKLGAFAYLAEEPRRGRSGPSGEALALKGMCIAVKDNIDVAGWPMRAGSAALGPEPVAVDAEVVTRILAAGADIVAKTALDEFAFTTYGPGMQNPYDRDLTVGGSSGGSALAVAVGGVCAALGTDTGGSVRIPAAYCGVVGFKPSYGLVPTTGVVPLAWSLDHVGVLSCTTFIASEVFGVLRRPPADLDNLEVPAVGERSLKGLRVGVPDSSYLAAAVPDVRNALDATLAMMTEAGAVVRTVKLPEVKRVLAFHLVVLLAEAATYHSDRFDDLTNHGVGVQRWISRGVGFSAREYITARRAMLGVRSEVADLFDSVDVLVLPTVPTFPPALSATTVLLGDGTEVDSLTASIWYTALFNATGMPAISLPVPSSSLPIGVQLAAAHLDDDLLLAVASKVEEGWNDRRRSIEAGGRVR